MVTVIYKSPQDLALSDCTFITLSFIHTALAWQACLLFLELSYLRGLCCTHFCPTSAWNALFSTFAPLLSSLSLVFGYGLLPKRGPPGLSIRNRTCARPLSSSSPCFVLLYDTQKCSSICLCVSFSSVAQSCPTLRPHGLQYSRLPCPSPTPRAYSNSCPSSW